MADLSDVESALLTVIVQIIYPGGTMVPSVTGSTTKIFRGWPSTIGLNADLAAGTSSITIFSDPKATRETTRYPRIWRTTSITAPSISMVTSGQSVSFLGQGGTSQLVGVKIGDSAYSVAVDQADTPLSVASALAAIVPGATADGVTVNIPGSSSVIGRVAGLGTATMETRRQEQAFVVSVWCPDPGTRDKLAGLLDASLSSIDWLQFQDGSAGLIRYRETVETDTSENANLYRRDLIYNVEYPTITAMTSCQMLFGLGNLDVDASTQTSQPGTVAGSGRPKLGAIRFDAWYDPGDFIDQQCAAALSSSSQWTARCPANSVVNQGNVSWPLADQAVLDSEILAASRAGLDYWAFDSFKPGDGLSRALSLYLSSGYRSRLGFCMLGQISNWADPSSASGYSTVITRDLTMMSEAGYLHVLGNRPVYYVLDASPAQVAYLPGNGMQQAIAYVRQQAEAAGVGDPYIVWLSGAALVTYDNVTVAMEVGADAAGAYACPQLSGSTLTFADLDTSTKADWVNRSATGMSMVPTGMMGWDPRPLIEAPQPFYPVTPGSSTNSFYTEAFPAQLAQHITDLMTFTSRNVASCEAQLALVYAWNELLEGGWLIPTYTPEGPDTSRVDEIGRQLSTWKSTVELSASFLA